MGWKAECAVSMAMRMRRRAMVYEVIYRPLMRNCMAGGAINLLFASSFYGGWNLKMSLRRGGMFYWLKVTVRGNDYVRGRESGFEFSEWSPDVGEWCSRRCWSIGRSRDLQSGPVMGAGSQ